MERPEVVPTGADPELPHLEVPVIVAREAVREVAVPIEVQALEATNPIGVRLLEQEAIAPQEAEVQALGVAEATVPEVVPEAPGEATEALGDPIDLQVVVGLREAVDLQVEVVEVEEIKPIKSSRTLVQNFRS